MAPFYPLYIRRSDGKIEIKSKSGKESNQPIAEQLDTKPNAQGISDFYRECPAGDAKEIDWRRKLGGMLIRQLASNQGRDKNYILAALPENYRLFEHIKCKFSDIDGKPQKITKNHAAGANERQDAYLYGHPHGRRKRYRSPAEFFPHLLWLVTDESSDTNNCSCKLCSPEEVESEEKLVQKPVQKEVKHETITKSEVPAPLVPRRTSQQSVPNAQGPPLEATPLPRPRSLEQARDAMFNKFYYRLGELVWFQRGQAWGLGAVIARDELQSFQGIQLQYRVQPLSHPHSHPAAVTGQQNQLRPWLAWSPPPCTCAGLNPTPENNNKVFTYEMVNWQLLLQGGYGQGDAEVDASILSAKAVETTFTLLDRIDAKISAPGSSQTSEISYNGMWLGAERIWLGDPLRLRSQNSPTDILILHAIIERPSPNDPSRSQIVLVGDTYALQPTNLSPSAVPQNEVYLPLRVREDLRARNNIAATNADPAKRTSLWRLQAKSVKMTIADIKGRWYENSIFVPLIDQTTYENNRRIGELGDAGLWMNGHGDCNRPPGGPMRSFKPADFKARRREDAFGRSVPSGFTISKGLDGTRGETQDVMKDVKMEDRSNTPVQFRPREAPPLTQTAQQTQQLLQQQQHAQQQQHPQQLHNQPLQHQQQQQQPQPRNYPAPTKLPLPQPNNDIREASPFVSVPGLDEANFDQYMKFDDADDDQTQAPGADFSQNYNQYYTGDEMQQ